MIQNAISGGHKILLFSQFTTMLEIIEQRLKKEDISYYLLNGATPKEKRINMVEQFNKDDTSVFCILLFGKLNAAAFFTLNDGILI